MCTNIKEPATARLESEADPYILAAMCCTPHSTQHNHNHMTKVPQLNKSRVALVPPTAVFGKEAHGLVQAMWRRPGLKSIALGVKRY